MTAEKVNSALDISVLGEQLSLLPQRALLWRARKMLIVADIHFGKAAAFRAGGIPVPHGTTRANLDALDALIATHGIGHILFLGDFLHAKTARAPATLLALQRWRESHPDLQLTLVRGNHDRHAGDPPPQLAVDVVDEPWRVGPLALCHHPQELIGAYVLAGHVHPVVRLSVGRDSLRLPCFVFGAAQATLPAFGAFTGGYEVSARQDEQLFVCTDDRVFAYPRTA
ncbi:MULTISPECIES: ligase-associated DNA damage response endonuclease PdeM [unclassified Herbaspirillum]|jgi:DNA ligase-associated metallophosphoesterase|uniref:ligase-associated DNA damage response endonuclease PdeM n=1 Tax=unclassified Herbaspirillum TaxID=2624150 RepID=UPI000E2FD663|nr:MULTISPECIES: ligase-associated DNA damage response endonuclease PdeM [unclassified Herbaspirillum]RFB71228.1 ligase-associated DNA damage response endonuclease PdeM [Herbaspirillum sp. 3R-3a1]TFI08235.1 ligase-associated DNA damage response endonuclease PdeM [Herbaspirillum sp. 3R11]TFI14650.1 ligase-associated DNA damage response endonuclease PdeM [Herbaspirillum sp. 3R-11]TFI31958.1 ligase-associated DNA damage response endonuclease PdeM [Herbaspirillum sp. 3C11]TFI31959.1 ligase-associa